MSKFEDCEGMQCAENKSVEQEGGRACAALRGCPARMREKDQRMPDTSCGSGRGGSRRRAVARAAMPSRNASETGTSRPTSDENSASTDGSLKALHSLSASFTRCSASGL